jgi:hypothetical protein
MEVSILDVPGCTNYISEHSILERAKTWGPSGALVRWPGSHERGLRHKGPVSLKPRCIGAVRPQTHITIYLHNVWQLATGWTVWESNPGVDEIFSTCPDRSWGPPSLLYNGYWVFPGGKAVGAEVKKG